MVKDASPHENFAALFDVFPPLLKLEVTADKQARPDVSRCADVESCSLVK